MTRVDVTRLRRLAKKPPRYVLWRAAQEARRTALRRTLRLALEGRGPLAPDRIVPGGVEAALPVTAANVQAIAPWRSTGEHSARVPELRRQVHARAARAVARRIELFGDAPIEVGIPPRWNEDPRSGHEWPRRYHGAIDYVNPGRPSDVKVVWELSRLRHLVALAQALAVLGRDEIPAGTQEAIEADLESWIRENPLGWSVNWSVSMEVALRAMNLVCVDGALRASGELGELRKILVPLLYQHGWFLFRNLEVSGLNGNHFLANGVGLVWLGRYFEGIGESSRWFRHGVDMVLRAAREHVLPGGLDHEGSLPYHALVLELFLLARVAAGQRVAGGDATLRRMHGALRTLAGPEGDVPDLGDDDGGRAAAFSAVPSRDARRVLTLGAAILGEPPPHWAEGDPWTVDALWLCGREALKSASPAARRETPARIDHLVVLGRERDHIVLDAGPIGFRGRGGHGHVDAPSFVAWLGGHQVVRDSGTGTYTRHETLRNRLREASAHTLCVVDGIPYARPSPLGLWQLEGDSPPFVEEVHAGRDFQRVVVSQLVPAASGDARIHRTVTWRPGELVWIDEILAPLGGRIVQFTQLPCEVEPEDSPTRLLTPHLVYECDLPGGAAVELVDTVWSRRYDSSEPGKRAIVRLAATRGPALIRWRVGLR